MVLGYGMVLMTVSVWALKTAMEMGVELGVEKVHKKVKLRYWLVEGPVEWLAIAYIQSLVKGLVEELETH